MVKRTPKGQCISNKAISSHLYPNRPYRYKKSSITQNRNDLESQGYIETLKHCINCGLKLKSLPEKCPQCDFRILDIDEKLDFGENRNNGKNPHFGSRPTRKAIEEMDDFFLSVELSLEEYKEARKSKIQHEILNHIEKLEHFSLNIFHKQENLKILTLRYLDEIFEELKDLRKLFPDYYNLINDRFWDNYFKQREDTNYSNGDFNEDLFKILPEQLEDLRNYITRLSN